MGKVDAIDIRPCDLETVRAILRRHVPDKEVWAFGSRVQWTARDYSDLDLAICTDEPIPLKVMGAISEELSESNLPMKVDVLDMASVSEKFRGIIEEEYAVVQQAGRSGWRNTKLGEICRINPDSRDSDWHHEAIRYVDISSVGSGIFNESPKKIPIGEAPGRAKRLVTKGDTIVSTVRPNRRSFMFFNSPSSDTVASTGFAVLRARRDVADPRFLYYLVTRQEFTDYLASRAEGSAYPAVNPSVFGDADVCIPPLSEQRKIAHILGTLDDKIELNRCMNETLEAMAQAVFKSWFVDFDPVHAKAKGRDTGLPPEVADLFPDGFEDSELGEIPRGWGVATLDDVAEIIKGRSYKSIELEPSDTALVTLKSFRRGGGYRPDGLKPYTGEYEPDQVVKPGELIISYTDVTQAGEIIGMPAIVLPTGEFSTLVASLDVGIVRSKVEYLSIPYLYHTFLTKSFRSHIYAHSAGTTVLHLNAKGLLGYKLVIPPKALCLRYKSLCEPLLHGESLNHGESCALGDLRDVLIPNLLSGQIQSAENNTARKIR